MCPCVPELFTKSYRSSHQSCFLKKGVLKNFADPKACNSIKKNRIQNRCFPVKFAKFLRTPIFKNICKRLFLILDRPESRTSKLRSFLKKGCAEVFEHFKYLWIATSLILQNHSVLHLMFPESDVYSGPCQTSVREFFEKIVNGLYLRMDQVKFVEDSLSKPYPFKFFLKAVFHKYYLVHSWI